MKSNPHLAQIDIVDPIADPRGASELELQRYIFRCSRSPLNVSDDYPDIRIALNRAWFDVSERGFIVDAEFPSWGQELEFWPTDPREGSKVEAELFSLIFVGLSRRELVSNAMNISKWHAAAVEQFAGLARPFAAPIADASVRPKHYPRPSDRTEVDLLERSCTGESMLGFGVTDDVISEICRDVEDEFFDSIFGATKYRGFVDCLGPIGYAEGRVVNYLAIEWAHEALHAYPVTEREYQEASRLRGEGVGRAVNVTSDVAQGFMVTER